MSDNINAAKCIVYLRSVGVSVSGEVAESWQAQEADFRAAGRASRRELKRSCGHFRTHTTRIVHGGGITDAKYCSDCRKPLEYRGASL